MFAALSRSMPSTVCVVVRPAVDQQRVAVVDHAGVGVHPAVVLGVADVLRVADLARHADAGGRPHVADRPAEAGGVLADHPAAGVGLVRVRAVLQGDVHRTGDQGRLDPVTVGVGDAEGGDDHGGVVAGHAEGATAQGVGDDDADGAGVLDVLGLQHEVAPATVDQTDLARQVVRDRRASVGGGAGGVAGHRVGRLGDVGADDHVARDAGGVHLRPEGVRRPRSRRLATSAGELMITCGFGLPRVEQTPTSRGSSKCPRRRPGGR